MNQLRSCVRLGGDPFEQNVAIVIRDLTLQVAIKSQVGLTTGPMPMPCVDVLATTMISHTVKTVTKASISCSVHGPLAEHVPYIGEVRISLLGIYVAVKNAGSAFCQAFVYDGSRFVSGHMRSHMYEIKVNFKTVVGHLFLVGFHKEQTIFLRFRINFIDIRKLHMLR